MTGYLVAYDIGSNTLRRYLVKKLQQLGAKRLQKSVFWLKNEPKRIAQMQAFCEKLSQSFMDTDNILLMRLPKDAWLDIHCIGNKTALEQIKQDPQILFF